MQTSVTLSSDPLQTPDTAMQTSVTLSSDPLQTPDTAMQTYVTLSSDPLQTPDTAQNADLCNPLFRPSANSWHCTKYRPM